VLLESDILAEAIVGSVRGMAELHRINRRLFLSDVGRRTVAFAVLGPGVLAACSSDGELTIESQVKQPTTSTTAGTSTTASEGDSTTSTEASTAVDDGPPELQWQRVVLGNVSAYVLARGDEVSIVDTGRSGSTTQIEQALTTLGADWSHVGRVILTHLHSDHTGGLPGILDLAGSATVYAGRADADAIDAEREVQPLDDGDEVFGMQVIATPGHTPGHIAVLDPTAGFLVAGDALNESGGMVLGPNPSFSSDIALANASVQRLADRSYETVVFGHGNPIESGASDAVLALAQTLS